MSDIYKDKKKEFEQIRTMERSGQAVSLTVNNRSKSGSKVSAY